MLFADKSTLESLPGPKELHICLKVVLVEGVENYEKFSNYTCQICEWFAGESVHTSRKKTPTPRQYIRTMSNALPAFLCVWYFFCKYELSELSLFTNLLLKYSFVCTLGDDTFTEEMSKILRKLESEYVEVSKDTVIINVRDMKCIKSSTIIIRKYLWNKI